VAEGAELDPGWASASRAWWLGSRQPRQRRGLLNACRNCGLGGKICLGHCRVRLSSSTAPCPKPFTCFPGRRETSGHRARCGEDSSSLWINSLPPLSAVSRLPLRKTDWRGPREGTITLNLSENIF